MSNIHAKTAESDGPIGEVTSWERGRSRERPTLSEAQAYCRRLAQTHYENFTVASWLLPKDLRQHFANIYAFCRCADDLADETGDPQRSLALLDAWEDQLACCFAGESEHPVFVALADTVKEYSIPIAPFQELLSAFRQDQTVTRYETLAELLDYCRRSANPVGRLVLHLGRCCTPENAALSDSVCTGLQLVNFWQDVARDWQECGRLYLPTETMERHGIDEQTIAQGQTTTAFREAIAAEVSRAEDFLNAGWPLVASVAPELRIDVELFIRGGLAVAQAIRRSDFDVLRRRPTVSKHTKLRLLAATWWRQRVLRRYNAVP